VLLRFSEAGFARMATPPQFLSLRQRLGVSAAAGVAGSLAVGLAAGRLDDRIAGKLIFRLASETLLKAAAGRAAGAGAGFAAGIGAGAAAGAAAGTLAAPGPGTVAGGVLGILGGVAAFLATDWLLLELEESVSREDFRREIMNSIADLRLETRRAIRGV
jgi:hypothetical protein